MAAVPLLTDAPATVDGQAVIAHNVSVICMHSYQSQFTLHEVNQTTAVEHDLVWGGCLVAKPVRIMCVVVYNFGASIGNPSCFKAMHAACI